MRSIYLMFAAAGLNAAVGCHDNSPPPQRVPVPSSDNREVRLQYDNVKPLPAQDHLAYGGQPQPAPSPSPAPSGPAPTVTDVGPAQTSIAFAREYARVGRPRIAAFVNRTAIGVLLPGNGEVERTVPAGVKGSERLPESSYEAIESAVGEWFAAQGRIDYTPPETVRTRLTETQNRDLEKGKGAVLSDVANFADIFIQIQATPTGRDSRLNLTAEALNARGGDLLGRQSAEVITPSDHDELRGATRDVIRRLGDDMAVIWVKYPSAPIKDETAATMPSTAPSATP